MEQFNFETKIQKILSFENLSKQLEEAANLIKNDEILAFPTETVYGLGANALSEVAVKKIFKAKGRPVDNPIIIHVSSVEMFEQLIDKEYFDYRIKKLQESFWPGPLTLIIKKSKIVPYVTTGGLETVAIRMPSNPIALALIQTSGLPIAAPSANLSGKPSPTTANDVYEDMNKRIALIIDGGSTEIGLESTVLDISDPKSIPIILRPGKITKKQLADCLSTQINIFDSTKIKENEIQKNLKSPGMKYRHYAPKADVIIVSSFDDFLKSYKEVSINNVHVGVMLDKNLIGKLNTSEIHFNDSFLFMYTDNEDLGANLYLKLREMDNLGVNLIIIQFDDFNDPTGFGLAIKNRLQKASSKK